MPEPDSVRVEEFVNYFDYKYQLPSRDETFTINLAAAPSPYSEREDSRLLQVGIQGYDIPADERPDVVLTFVVDVSGSMDMENRIHARQPRAQAARGRTAPDRRGCHRGLPVATAPPGPPHDAGGRQGHDPAGNRQPIDRGID